MKRLIVAAVALAAIAGSTAVYAQQRGPGHWHRHMRMAPEDRTAFLDARIAAVHAGLKLSPDQEKMWPPLEAAVRDFAKLRIDRANARMQAREDRGPDARGPDAAPRERDPVARLRARAEAMGDDAAALKKIADAADPLYKTLDDGQKRRLAVLTHMKRHGFESDMRRFGGDDERRFDRGPRREDFGRDGRGERRRDAGPDRL